MKNILESRANSGNFSSKTSDSVIFLQSFKRFRFNMMTFQCHSGGLEGYRGEILQTDTAEALKFMLGSPIKFFQKIDHLCKVSSDFMKICKLSKIQTHKRKWTMFEPQVNSSNFSREYYQWPKLSFFIKNQ